MPEIVEVETIRKTLLKSIIKKKITDIKINYPKMIVSNLDEFKKIKNQTFTNILRRGKWLIFELDDYYLLSHLRMEGKYFIKDQTEEINKHEHVIFSLDNNKDLRYHDVRKFGQMLLCNKEELYKLEQIKKQGIEANSEELNGEYLKLKMKNKRLPIKSTLLDQTIISGLGNIYADEVLFHAKVNPLKQSNLLTENELNKLALASIEIVNRAMELGGTTIRSYQSSLGVKGQYQNELKVHTKVNYPCQICNTKIEKIKVGGRSTYYCPNCQDNEK